MTRLERLRLINWHYFTDQTIDFGAATLLAGDNGSGKSTIIDAIQYALVANVQKIRFNAAAGERRTTRDLAGYVRCKLGTEGTAYLRGATIAHVALEFHRPDGQSFCAGIMVEADEEGISRETPWLWLGGGVSGRLDFLPFLEQGRLCPAGRFRDLLKERGAKLASTKAEYQKDLTFQLHVYRKQSEFNPYLETLLRSVSFQPFGSVHDFVCNYILDERPVDISTMRENLRHYQEAEREARIVQAKIAWLDKVTGLLDRIVQLDAQLCRQDWFLLRLQADFDQATLRLRRQQIGEAQAEQARKNLALEQAETAIERVQGLYDQAAASLYHNEVFQTWHRLGEDIARLDKDILIHEAADGRLRLLAGQLAALLPDLPLKLERLLDNDAEAGVLDTDLDQRQAEIIRRQTVAQADRAACQAELDELRAEQAELGAGGRLRYPAAAETLRQALRDAGIEAWYFCELLEMANEDWHNAAEGWLNTQRFNILVPEADFDRALAIYRAQAAEVAGVGIPDTARMERAEARRGSLAEVLDARTAPAEAYRNFLLGRVMRVEPADLRKCESAVTRDCLQYHQRTASRIKPEIWQRWYIGEEARRQRLALLARQIDTASARLGELDLALRQLAQDQQVLERARSAVRELADQARLARRLGGLREQRKQLCRHRDSLDTSSLGALESTVQRLRRELESGRGEIGRLQRELGEAAGLIRQLTDQEAQAGHEASRSAAALAEFETGPAFDPAGFPAFYQDRLRDDGAELFGAVGQVQRLERLRQLQANTQRNMGSLRTQRRNAEEEAASLMNGYNHHKDWIANPPLAPRVEAGPAWREARRLLAETELPAYLDRIQRARQAAETQFVEHFVVTLNEHLAEAKSSFDDINRHLRDLRFGSDQYRFVLEERTERRKLLAAVRHAAEVHGDRGTLFEELADPEDRASIENLFQQLLSDEADSPQLRDICDYRQYFVYDIRIRHHQTVDPTTGLERESLLSKVLRDKSGGEAQTPYYVAIAASFFRFTQGNPQAVRLLLLDEAFNKMDDARIADLMAFLRQLGLQVVTAVPTEKLKYLQPACDCTHIVLRHDQTAFTTPWRQIPAAEAGA